MGQQTPETIQELIDLLSNLYPDRCPSLHDSEREIFYAAGQRSVVEKCLQIMNVDLLEDNDSEPVPEI